MTSRRSMRSEIRGDREDAQRRSEHDRRGEQGDAAGRHADLDREYRTEGEQGAVRSPGGQRRQTRNRRQADEPDEAWPHASRLGGRIDAGHRHRHDREREQRPCDGEGRESVRSKRPQSQLSARGSDEIGNLVESVERAAIGVGRFGVDPGLDNGVEPGEHEADERATGEPRQREDHDGHKDHRSDRQRDKGGVGPDVTAAPNDRRRGEGPGQHSGEIDRPEQTDGQLGEAVDARPQRRRHADQAVAADQEQHREQESGDGGKDAQKGRIGVGVSIGSGMVSHHRPARDVVVRLMLFDKMRGCLENRHIGRKRPTVYRAPGGREAAAEPCLRKG